MKICFPDDNCILASQGVRDWQATLQPSEPLLKPAYHWEGNRLNLYGSVFPVADGYEMFYQCGNAMRVGYAFSEDGLDWRRPLINPTDLSAHVHQVVQGNDDVDPTPAPEIADAPVLKEGQELTNLVAGYHMPSVIYEPDSEHPYQLFAFGEGGYRVLYSSDGRRFREYANNPAIELLLYQNPTTEKKWASDVAPCFRDRQGYTAMVKTYAIDKEGRSRRCVGRSTSQDFMHWSPVETLWEPGEAEDAIARTRGLNWADFYGLCPFAYGSGYLGFLWLFEIEHEFKTGTHLGKMEVFLAYSADGKQWRRMSDEALIPWDLNFGEAGGMVTTPSAPLFEDGEVKVYYSDSNYDHGYAERDFGKPLVDPTWVIRCARLEKDRLAGIQADEGWLELNELDFSIGDLKLNLAAAGGEVTLSYRQNGKVVASQTLSGCDATEMTVLPAWQGPAVLRIHIRNAVLHTLELGV